MEKKILFFVFFLTTLISFSQNQYEDVVYLKNGGIMRGVIIEQIPNKSIKIETIGRNVFFYEMDAIEKITKELPFVKEHNSGHKKGYLGLSIGISNPVGEFGADIILAQCFVFIQELKHPSYSPWITSMHDLNLMNLNLDRK